MIKSAKLGKEIVVTVVNKIGVLADISKLVADHGVNIVAVAGYADKDNNAKIMLVSEDNLRTIEALKKSGYSSVVEKETLILELENRPGVLKDITAKLAREDIDIKQVYGTTCAQDCPAKMIISTSDNAKALVAFKK